MAFFLLFKWSAEGSVGGTVPEGERCPMPFTLVGSSSPSPTHANPATSSQLPGSPDFCFYRVQKQRPFCPALEAWEQVTKAFKMETGQRSADVRLQCVGVVGRGLRMGLTCGFWKRTPLLLLLLWNFQPPSWSLLGAQRELRLFPFWSSVTS